MGGWMEVVNRSMRLHKVNTLIIQKISSKMHLQQWCRLACAGNVQKRDG